jgi:hypothetical protein
MNKYVMSLPFRLCRLKIKGRNIGYCKNQGLIDAITFIGEYRAPYEKNKSPYKRGIAFIRNAYERSYKEWISKAEIKRLMRPNYKRRHCLKIPSRAIKILECIALHIDFPTDCTSHKHCIGKKTVFCHNNNINSICCYRYLVYNLYVQLEEIEGLLDQKSIIYSIYKEIEDNKKKC